jgi:MOSC domain-containing protein YiiM
MTARIVSICYRPAHVELRPQDRYARVPIERARLIVNHGIESDTKGTSKARQLNVMSAEVVERLRQEGFRAAPGELGEQLVIAGLEQNAMTPGTRIRLGASAIIEIGNPRTPCSRFAHIQGKSIKEAWGRIGVLARVVSAGEIAVGDEVACSVGLSPHHGEKKR